MLARLAARWDRPPGDRFDLWLSCEPADEPADRLTAGLAEAVGLPPGTSLDARIESERVGSPTAAIVTNRTALPLWRGEPFADATFPDWAQGIRTRVQVAYVAAALRAGELLLSSGALAAARTAAAHAISAEPTSEPAYRLLLRSLMAAGDVAGARRALDDLRRALADLGVEPEPGTVAIVTNVPRRSLNSQS